VDRSWRVGDDFLIIVFRRGDIFVENRDQKNRFPKGDIIRASDDVAPMELFYFDFMNYAYVAPAGSLRLAVEH
jgi:hypothetical protein